MPGTLIVSISGIRGVFGDGLDPAVLVRFGGAFGTWCRRRAMELGREPAVVIGRDARVSGDVCARIVSAALQSAGVDVVDAGLATTPTVEMAVQERRAAGGIVLSASHNPPEWNALKLLNEKGEFLTAREGEEVLRIVDDGTSETVGYEGLGTYERADFLNMHIDRILELDWIDAGDIAAADFKVVVDAVNSVGGIALPALLTRLGVREENIVRLHCEPTGRFAHPAEPLPEHLTELTELVASTHADLGIAVDPDVDRLALVADGGTYMSEELTQVVAADFMWKRAKGPFVTNLSSSRAVDDLAEAYGQTVFRSAVGEINVVQKMQEVGAILGGEGNGGVIVPELHYGRDALVGTAIVLQHLATEKVALSEVMRGLPRYTISKNKTAIGDTDPDTVLADLARQYADEETDTTDGLKINFMEEWVHLRKSNTEPIIRIYAEARTAERAGELAERFMEELQVSAATVSR
ncbi:MAG: phosphoglucosamine mutase [Rhodothermales bacterium]